MTIAEQKGIELPQELSDDAQQTYEELRQRRWLVPACHSVPTIVWRGSLPASVGHIVRERGTEGRSQRLTHLKFVKIWSALEGDRCASFRPASTGW